ncbi:MAG: Ku protein [Planctomycetaceae bacterium]|nr:Ku protein [Planctomycetaceae bacterium]
MPARRPPTPTTVREIGRASWSGTLRIGLVTFPVQAFNVVVPEKEIHLHQLHAACDRRIHYQKVCPVHGEVPKDEIVSAYEYSRGKYVRIEPDELDELRTEADRALRIEAFIKPKNIDTLCMDGRNYFLTPQKEEAREPYGVIYRAMVERDRWGVGQILFSEREQLVLVRPYQNVFLMSMLRHCDELRRAQPYEVTIPRSSDKTVKLAEQLIDNASEDTFDFAAYGDPYRAKLKELIDSKIEGKKIATPPAEAEPEVINLADALRKSIALPHEGRRQPPRRQRRGKRAS